MCVSACVVCLHVCACVFVCAHAHIFLKRGFIVSRGRGYFQLVFFLAFQVDLFLDYHVSIELGLVILKSLPFITNCHFL